MPEKQTVRAWPHLTCCLQDGATTLSITARQYLGGPRLSTDLRPIFTSTTLGASYELLQQLQLVEQAEAGDPDESPIQAWAAIELDGQLDPAAHLVEFKPSHHSRGTRLMKVCGHETKHHQG
jgi:hypothetical protein